MKNKPLVEVIEYYGIKYAEIIWAHITVEKTTFFSPTESSFQFGLLSHKKGFQEPPHYHMPFNRQITDLQQMFMVQRGVVGVELYSNTGKFLREIILRQGDSIVLIHGVHAINVYEDMQCISVKQGPFLGTEVDKVFVEVESRKRKK